MLSFSYAPQARIEYPGAFYHVIVRGNQRQRIFKEPADYQKYLLTLTVYQNRYQFHLYAYVLMGNHVHLLIETGDVPLSKILQGISQTYTLYYNRKYRTVGHLFQGRYKAILCDRDAYLLGLVRYIHENPLRARIVKTLREYTWSSHHAYDGRNYPLGLVDTDQVLRLFSESKGRARNKYRLFMEEESKLTKQDVYATIDQRLQGDEGFVERVMKQYDGPAEGRKKKKKRSLAAIARAIEGLRGVQLDAMRTATKQRTVSIARKVFAHVAREYGYRGNEIAAYLDKTPVSVTMYLRPDQEISTTAAVLFKHLDKRKNVNNEF